MFQPIEVFPGVHKRVTSPNAIARNKHVEKENSIATFKANGLYIFNDQIHIFLKASKTIIQKPRNLKDLLVQL